METQKRDEKTGRFETTTNLNRYKYVQFNNKRMGEQHREFCLALNIPQIPKGLIVHHIDENTKNNKLDNLALVTITGHNRIHKHTPWNKGLSAKDNPKWAKILQKSLKNRKETYYKKIVVFLEYYNKYKDIKTQQEMSDELGLRYHNFRQKLSNYKQEYEKINNK